MLPKPAPIPAPLNKPIELYIFLDPLHDKAVSLMTIIRKFQLEYEHYFTWRLVLSTDLTSLNCISNRTKGCISGDAIDITHPVLPSLAIKAAELQGKRAGSRFLAKLQEYLLQQENVTTYSTLMRIATELSLDLEEFKADFSSKEAARALQCDLYIRREMDVDEVPSFVFFNECIEDEGLKVGGHYDYEVYEHILSEMLEEQIIRQPIPSLEEIFTRYNALSTEDIALIYSIPINLAERELKKRMLQQKVERFQTKLTSLWRLRQSK